MCWERGFLSLLLAYNFVTVKVIQLITITTVGDCGIKLAKHDRNRCSATWGIFISPPKNKHALILLPIIFGMENRNKPITKSVILKFN